MKRFGISMVMAGALLNGVGHAATRARFAAENVLRDAGGRLSAGRSHTCQVKDVETVRCWGAINQGQLGDGTTQDRHAPVTISGLTNVVAVNAGNDHTCALLADGTARCWGDHSFGQLGNRAGPGGRSLTPVLVTFLSQAVAIIAGDSHTCTLTRLGTVGSVRWWGKNPLANSATSPPAIGTGPWKFSRADCYRHICRSNHTCVFTVAERRSLEGSRSAGKFQGRCPLLIR